MKDRVREIRYFFFSQDFSDGLRITLAILLPSVVLRYFGHFDIGLTLSLGAVCTSILDAPGPLIHKRNGMLLCILSTFLVAVITAFARMSMITMALEIAVFSFFFSMFNLYGNRAASLGSASLLIMILTMDKPLEAKQALGYGLLAMTGGIWYLGLSLLSFRINVYRPAERALGSCIHEISRFLRIKSRFYLADTDLDENYRDLITQQIVVNEKQEAVREMLFKSRVIMKESTETGRLLVLTFVEMMDLYEDMMSMYYDYTSVHERFGRTGILEEISYAIRRMAEKLDTIGLAIQSGQTIRKKLDLEEQLIHLKSRVDALAETEKGLNTLVLRKILVNLRKLYQRLTEIEQLSNTLPEDRKEKDGGIEYKRFVSSQEYDVKAFRDNLSFNSNVFKHSLRMTAACLLGFIVAKFIAPGHHSYWILLTISVILKPAFSLTKKRNIQRISGTVIGGIIGILILYLVRNHSAQFAILVLFMIGAYSFQRINYIIMVIFVTPYVLILFRFLGIAFISIIEERVLDTAIGCVIAFACSYLIFPSWESKNLHISMLSVLRANVKYLLQLSKCLAGTPPDLTEYKVIRKEVYVSSANLSSAFQRMTSEPKSKQRNVREVHKFVVLNHILSSNIATIGSSLMNRNIPAANAEAIKPVKRAIMILQENIKKLDAESTAGNEIVLPELPKKDHGRSLDHDDHLLLEQLDFICKLSTDIGKLTDKLILVPAE